MCIYEFRITIWQSYSILVVNYFIALILAYCSYLSLTYKLWKCVILARWIQKTRLCPAFSNPHGRLLKGGVTRESKTRTSLSLLLSRVALSLVTAFGSRLSTVMQTCEEPAREHFRCPCQVASHFLSAVLSARSENSVQLRVNCEHCLQEGTDKRSLTALYEASPEVWDSLHMPFKDREKRSMCWQAMGETLKASY